MNGIPSGFKGRLSWLIANVRKSDGAVFSNSEIGEAIGKTSNYIWQLQNKDINPSLGVVQKIAKLFGVGLAFFDEEPPVRSLKELFDSDILVTLAKNAPELSRLSKEDTAALLRVIELTIKSD